jgi:hypothetical protein
MTSAKQDLEQTLSQIRLNILAQNAKRLEIKKQIASIEDTIVSLKEEERKANELLEAMNNADPSKTSEQLEQEEDLKRLGGRLQELSDLIDVQDANSAVRAKDAEKKKQ